MMERRESSQVHWKQVVNEVEPKLQQKTHEDYGHGR
jgi:hypothetical protein